MREPKITESEWRAELDRCRPHKIPDFTAEQWAAIEYARETKPEVMWKDIVAFLKRRYNITIAINTLRNRYETRKRK